MKVWGWAPLVTGLLLMVMASLWAPQQPELLQAGGACQLAPCGSLEDPSRWSRAWWVWSAGCASAVLGAAVVLERRRRRLGWMVVALGVLLPIYVLGLAIVAMVVSLLTSVQGATTTLVAGLVLPGVAWSSAWTRHGRAARSRSTEPDLEEVAPAPPPR